jgi:hypothetical protein
VWTITVLRNPGATASKEPQTDFPLGILPSSYSEDARKIPSWFWQKEGKDTNCETFLLFFLLKVYSPEEDFP